MQNSKQKENMAREIVNPITVDSKNSLKEKVTTHPAYAQISATRVTGGSYLYGSDFRHNGFITISIKRSENHRGLSRDWHHDREELIEVSLSEAQWATFVSSLNIGSGVPCTMTRLNGQSVPGIPAPVQPVEQFKDEMLQSMQEIQRNLESLLEGLGDESLSKGKVKELRRNLEIAKDRLTGNTGFVAKKFDKHMETVVERAKVEVNAHAMNLIIQTGLDAISNGKPAISFLSDDAR